MGKFKVLTLLLAGLLCFSLSGCGNAYLQEAQPTAEQQTETNHQAESTQQDANESTNRPWTMAEKVNTIESIFSVQDIRTQTEADGTTQWVQENENRKAVITQNQDSWYLDYEQKNSGQKMQQSIKAIPQVQVSNTLFYEADMTGNGKDELIVISPAGTGTGMNNKSIQMYDLDKNEQIPVFADENFTQQQTADILSTLVQWEQEGFSEKIQLDDSGNMLKTKIFVPSIVSYRGKTAVQVDFATKEQYYPKDSRLKGSFSAIFMYQEGTFQLEYLSYHAEQ